MKERQRDEWTRHQAEKRRRRRRRRKPQCWNVIRVAVAFTLPSAAHFLLLQMPLMQSELTLHALPTAQRKQPLPEPPQSTSVSAPPLTLSKHGLAVVPLIEVHTPPTHRAVATPDRAHAVPSYFARAAHTPLTHAGAVRWH